MSPRVAALTHPDIRRLTDDSYSDGGGCVVQHRRTVQNTTCSWKEGGEEEEVLSSLNSR